MQILCRGVGRQVLHFPPISTAEHLYVYENLDSKSNWRDITEDTQCFYLSCSFTAVLFNLGVCVKEAAREGGDGAGVKTCILYECISGMYSVPPFLGQQH